MDPRANWMNFELSEFHLLKEVSVRKKEKENKKNFCLSFLLLVEHSLSPYLIFFATTNCNTEYGPRVLLGGQFGDLKFWVRLSDGGQPVAFSLCAF
jgi:hypothetical protein